MTKNDFYAFGEHCGLGRIACQKMMKKVISYEDTFVQMIENSVLKKELQEKFINLLKQRTALLS